MMAKPCIEESSFPSQASFGLESFYEKQEQNHLTDEWLRWQTAYQPTCGFLTMKRARQNSSAAKEDEAINLPSSQILQRQIGKMNHIASKTTRSPSVDQIHRHAGATKAAPRSRDLLMLQRMLDPKCKHPISYENRASCIPRRPPNAPLPSSQKSDMAPYETGSQSRQFLGASAKRLRALARDLVEHWSARQMTRKGNCVVICADGTACLELYMRLCELRPSWKRQGAIQLAAGGGPPSEAPVLQSTKRSRRFSGFQKPPRPLRILVTHDIWGDG